MKLHVYWGGVFLVVLLTNFIYCGKSQNIVQGTIFRDINWNGVWDPNEPVISNANIVVGARISSGSTFLATIDTNGRFRIDIGAATDFELSLNTGSLPGYYSVGFAKYGSSISPLEYGSAPANFSIAISQIEDYCADNVTETRIAATCFIFGDQINANPLHNDVLVTFNYGAGQALDGSLITPESGGLPRPASLAKSNQVGTIWGLAYQRSYGQLFASSFMKRYSAFGGNSNSNAGFIYRLDMRQNPPVSSVAVDLEAQGVSTGAQQLGTNAAHDTSNYNQDIQAWDHVGKYSLGGIAFDDRGEFLYVVSLFQQEIVQLRVPPPDSGQAITVIARISVPTPASCPDNNDVRAFGVTYRQSLLYVGAVCSAESSQDPTDLRAYVFVLDPATMEFRANPVLEFPLNYIRGTVATAGPSVTCVTGDRLPEPAGYNLANWRPWVETISEYPINTDLCFYPQPMLSAIDFSKDGNQMILALTDRFGHQSGNLKTTPPSGLESGVSAGDVLCAYSSNGGNSWVIEANATCGPLRGGVSYSSLIFGSSAPSSNTEFFSDDQFLAGQHSEVNTGSLAIFPGSDTVLSAVYDPIPSGGLTSFRTGGVRYYNTTNGSANKVYVIYQTDAGNNTFGKAIGLGDLQPLCNPVPLQIGNRLWFDNNFDGNQDIGETGIPNIPITLYRTGSQTPLLTTVSNPIGEWFFSSRDGLLPNTDYFIRVRKTDIDNFFSCNCTYLPPPFNVIASRNSHAIIDPVDPTYYRANIRTGDYGVVDHTWDMGFSKLLPLGDFVWCDRDYNGAQDVGVVSGEVPIPGVIVNLYSANNVLLDTRVTDANGNYTFYVLPLTTYSVVIDLNSNLAALGSCNLPTDPERAGVSTTRDSNGFPSLFMNRNSSVARVTLDIQPLLTVDFGFRYQVDIGDYVWFDSNSNGLQDPNESGIPNVEVTLVNTRTFEIITTQTNGTGYYQFNNINGNTIYEVFVAVDGSNTNAFNNLEPTAVNQGSEADSSVGVLDTFVEGTATRLVSIATVQIYGYDNFNVDFGFRLQNINIGDFVWQDTNENGLQDPNEPGIAGVQVQLLNATSVIATTTTNATGYYSFPARTNRNYTLVIPLQNGFLGNLVPTAPNQGGDVNLDSNGLVSATNGFVSAVVAAELSDNLSFDFGFRPTQNIGDYVWLDQNSNGLQDIAEPGIAGVDVSLYNSSSGLVATTRTNSSGYYLFTNLPPNTTFKVVISLDSPNNFAALDGKVPTRRRTTNTTINSKGIPGVFLNSSVAYIDVTVGITTNLTLDFGFAIPPPSCNYTTYLYHHRVTEPCVEDVPHANNTWNDDNMDDHNNNDDKNDDHNDDKNDDNNDDKNNDGDLHRITTSRSYLSKKMSAKNNENNDSDNNNDDDDNGNDDNNNDDNNDDDNNDDHEMKKKKVYPKKRSPAPTRQDVCSGAVIDVKVSATSTNTGSCIRVEPVPGVTLGHINYLALSGVHNPITMMSPIINVTSNGTDITSQLYIQQYTSGARVCAGQTVRRLCPDFAANEDPLRPVEVGDIVFCFACTQFDYSAGPVDICFANIRPFDFTTTAFKVRASSVVGTCDAQINAYGVLPTRCDNTSACLDANIVCDEQCNGRLPLSVEAWTPEPEVVCLEIRPSGSDSINSLEFLSFVGKNLPFNPNDTTVVRALDGDGVDISQTVHIETFSGDRACVTSGPGCIGFDTNKGASVDIEAGDINVCLSCHPFDKIPAPVQICFSNPDLELSSFENTIIKLKVSQVCGFCKIDTLKTVAVLQNTSTNCNDSLNWESGIPRSMYDAKDYYFPEKERCCKEKQSSAVWEEDGSDWSWATGENPQGNDDHNDDKEEVITYWWQESRWRN